MAEVNKRQITKMSSTYIASGVALITLMSIIGTSAFLKTTEVRVEGAAIYSIEEIVDSSGLSLGNNLIFVNAQTVSQSIRSALPFVNSAEVSRVWPGTVLIEITESDPVASIAFAGELLILDSSGRLLMQSTGGSFALSVNTQDLIEIRGVEISDASLGEVLRPALGAETRLQNMQDVLAALEREDMVSDVSYLDVSNTGNIQFGYLDMYRVIVGSIRDLRHKLGILPGALADIEFRFPNTTGDIDLSDPSDVRFRPS